MASSFVNKRLKRLVMAISLALTSLSVGILGFSQLEGYGFTEAFYMSVITISTVGYGELTELSEAGRIFTSFYIIFNIGIFAYSISVLTSYIFEGELRDVFSRYITNMGVKKLKDHVIVCGLGRNGARAVIELKKAEVPFIVLDTNHDVIKQNISENEDDFHYIIGDSTHDEILLMAGIEKAQALIAAMPQDANNVFVTLTARELNPKIKIIARASQASSEKKLYRAGANSVVMPDAIGGHMMATLITKPAVIEFIDMINGVGDLTLHMEQFNYEQLKKEYQDKTIREMNVRDVCGVTFLGIKHKIKGFIFNPNSEMVIDKYCETIVLGTKTELNKFITHFTNL